jgi:tyrosine-protein kinase Etk/Wzc
MNEIKQEQSALKDRTQNLYPEDEDEIKLTDLLLVLLKRKKVILLFVSAAIVVSVIISLLLPFKYTATARILPPTEPSSTLSPLSQITGALGGAIGILPGGFGKTSADLYVGILQSDAVADILIDGFDLQDYFKCKYKSDAYKILSGIAKFDVDRKTQIISISVQGKDPRKAADLANAYVDALDQINQKVNTTEGHRKRVFLEDRLKKVIHDLSKAETDLKTFQEKYKLIDIDEQSKAAIEGAAKIKGEIIASQTELEVLKQFGTEKQNEAIMLKSKIAELNKQLAKIETGNPAKDRADDAKKSENNPDFFIPFKEMPELGMQLARLIREVKVQESVFQLITSQYEMAKIDEAKDMNTIQFLDRAFPPDRRSSPKRTQIVILSTVVAFFFAVFLAFVLEYVDRFKREDPTRYAEFYEALYLNKIESLAKKFKRSRS